MGTGPSYGHLGMGACPLYDYHQCHLDRWLSRSENRPEFMAPAFKYNQRW